MPIRNVIGIVLAGGAGTRLGAGVPKADAVLGGVTLRERAVATLATVCPLVVVAAPRHRAGGDAAPARWAEEPGEGEGPLAGMVAGFAAGSFERAIVLGVDFPFVRPPLLRALLSELTASEALAVVPAPGGIPQPLVAAYSRRAADALAAAFAGGERSITRALAALAPRYLDDTALATLASGRDALMNVNTAEDLATAERRLADEEQRRRTARTRVRAQEES